MDFVDKADGPLALEIERVTRLIDGFAQFGDAGGNRGDRFEDGARLLREQQCDGGFAGPRRPPQDHRMQSASRNHLAEQLAGAEQMLLADDLVERTWTHPISERLSHRLPRAKESLIVVSLAACHWNYGITSRNAQNARYQARINQRIRNAKLYGFFV